MRFETLGRRIAAAPRAVVLGLLAATLALTPGAVRVRVAPTVSEWPEHALFALACDAGVWSRDCLRSVDELTRALGDSPALVARVDSLATRQAVVAEDGELRVQPFFVALPATPADLRRLHARALANPAVIRGLVAPGEGSTLIRAELRPGAAPREVHALVESLRTRFERPPEVSLAVAARAWGERELEARARRDLARLLPVTLAAFALLAGLALASFRAGALVAALAGVAVLWCAGAAGLAGLEPGAGQLALASAIAASAGAGALALAQRIRLERRGARSDGEAVARALAALGPPLGAAALAGAGAFLALALAGGGAPRALALGASGGLAGAALLVLVGLPAGWLVLRPGAPADSPAPRGFEAGVEAALARLDAGLRARGSWRRALAVLAVLGGAALGVRQLEYDPTFARFFSRGSAVADGAERIARRFGGSEMVRVELDSGRAGGALEPEFLERALALERALEPTVGATESLLDTAVLPAMRALHDGDPVFAVVPPTRAQVEEALALTARAAPAKLAAGLDPERRRLALEVFVDARDPRALDRLEPALAELSLVHLGRADAAALHGPSLVAARAALLLRRGALVSAFAAWAALAVLAGVSLGSARAGLVASAPSALAALVVFGAVGQLGVALDPVSACLGALAALAAAGPALLYLRRVRELRSAGAEQGVAASIALRDTGRPIGTGALAGLVFLGLLASGFPPVRWFGALAAFAVLAGTLLCLVVLPPLTKRFPV